MRLGGPVFGDFARDPDAWSAALRAEGYRAAYCPLDEHVNDATVAAFAEAARRADIMIAEVGAWSNPLSPNEETRQKALALCQARLDLADRIGARCCVNIAGSRGDKWDGPHKDDLTPDTFDLIVESVRAIVDAVKPIRTVYALETMPWMYPDSADSYLALLRAIDRPGAFGVHLDPVNLVNSPERFFRNADLLRNCFAKLGSHLVGCHAKDIALSPNLTVHLDEVRPGTGGLDYPVYLSELARLDPDIPLMLEHLPSADDYREAARHVRGVAAEIGLSA
jgi:sugar phosphate isomerase/epimerase